MMGGMLRHISHTEGRVLVNGPFLRGRFALTYYLEKTEKSGTGDTYSDELYESRFPSSVWSDNTNTAAKASMEPVTKEKEPEPTSKGKGHSWRCKG